MTSRFEPAQAVHSHDDHERRVPGDHCGRGYDRQQGRRQSHPSKQPRLRRGHLGTHDGGYVRHWESCLAQHGHSHCQRVTGLMPAYQPVAALDLHAMHHGLQSGDGPGSAGRGME